MWGLTKAAISAPQNFLADSACDLLHDLVRSNQSEVSGVEHPGGPETTDPCGLIRKGEGKPLDHCSEIIAAT